ncbi:hypothetical protein NBRC10512_001202 [Rhodotorula toruloides]|uniref:RHTO0S06e04324g1_1 n=2 Tax=Rhodotorula toruloides TaxID=5286 RepID=A0A061B3U9_RHOTO|nr:uncharacterized protein RHTO_06182 [Rhodotorula toruloides NP11]EMS24178.1 hypothetical protein RHTO_06182 [Rhodotorula toruloides NP11]CDR41693.1 RHTO0S06e04324g1_1 [Rhodotorula toruloides]
MAPVDLVRRSEQREIIALLLPQAIGSQVSLLFFGVYIVLHWNYVSNELYPRLSTSVKTTLWAVFLCTTAFELVQAADTLYWMVTANRTVEHIFNGVALDSVIPLVAACVGVPVQCLLAIRAGALLRTRWIRWAFWSVVGVGIVTAFAGAVLMCATFMMYVVGTIENIAPLTYNNAASIWLWTSAFVDLAISICLTITLSRRIQGFNDSTDSLLRKLIKVSLKTAAYTALLAVGGAIVASATNDNDVNAAYAHFAFWFPLPPCYALSLYTTLTTRKTVQQHLSRAFGAAADPNSHRTSVPPRVALDLSALNSARSAHPSHGAVVSVRLDDAGSDAEEKEEVKIVRRVEERSDWMPSLGLEGGGAIHGLGEVEDVPFADLRPGKAYCAV